MNTETTKPPEAGYHYDGKNYHSDGISCMTCKFAYCIDDYDYRCFFSTDEHFACDVHEASNER